MDRILSQHLVWSENLFKSYASLMSSQRHIKEKLICVNYETWKPSKWDACLLPASQREPSTCPKCSALFEAIKLLIGCGLLQTGRPQTEIAESSPVWFAPNFWLERTDGVVNHFPQWNSLCSQQRVMSVSRALKLTLIRALKTIT